MTGSVIVFLAIMPSLLLPGLATSQEADPQMESSIAPPLSPSESIATMQVQPGYRLIPVLTEPDIHEPSVIAWDGNGRMYVVEMRTYMQEIDGKNQFDPVSRVSRHEDTNGDGIYDKHSIFADNLSLPRMVLPLLDRVIIRETGTLDLKSYEDTDGDGVADRVELWHGGGDRGGNLEHQPSGLVWNVDNWIYTTYSNHRYRFTSGSVIREPLPFGSGQWGLTHDDVGRMFYSQAGGENPASDFQRPIVYGRIALPGEQADGFREVFPIDDIPDTQGGRARLREDNSLNRFTASCGQSIYRGDRLPSDLYGDLLICEPVGRLVRRAKVTNDDGRIILSNAYEDDEFIKARDPNFRPVNSATGPDGTLYLVDMYRGIIQEGNWVRPDSYLRGIVQEYELDKNIGRGRIYRIEHTSTQRGPQPRMLDESPLELVAHLSHPNGWWRSEAQKLIILHGDKGVVPALKSLARSGADALGRLHAYWTLEGLDAVDPALLAGGFCDSDARVRAAAMRISESFLEQDRSLDEGIIQLARDDDSDVVIQVLLSVMQGRHPEAGAITESIEAANGGNLAIRGIAEQLRSQLLARKAKEARLEELRLLDEALADSVVRGQIIYSTLCITCHGPDGTGLPSPDLEGLMLAPSLAGSSRVDGHKERLIRILLHGLIGPVDGETFAAGLMLPMGANDDRWIADVATFIRNSWDNRAPMISPIDVGEVRSLSQERGAPWTMAELDAVSPPTLEDRGRWILTASLNDGKVGNAVDGLQGTRWDTGTPQKPGMWFQIELPEITRVTSLTLDTRGSDGDYPRGYLVQLSNDGENWSDPVAQGVGTEPIQEIELDHPPTATRFIRITQTGQVPGLFWSIHELEIKPYIPDAGITDVQSLAQRLAEESPDSLAKEARLSGDARRGATLFYDQTLSCARCHDPLSGDRLAPDLSLEREGVNDTFLVQSVLEPSLSIRKGFETLLVETDIGLMFSGFYVEEDDEFLVLRDPAGGQEIELYKSEIIDRTILNLSPMPMGLVNQLSSREQFLDLVMFLMEVDEHGPARQTELRDQARDG